MMYIDKVWNSIEGDKSCLGQTFGTVILVAVVCFCFSVVFLCVEFAEISDNIPDQCKEGKGTCKIFTISCFTPTH